MMDTVDSWKSLKSTRILQGVVSIGQVMIYSIPKSLGYLAGKKGDVNNPPTVPFTPFTLTDSEPFKYNLLPAINYKRKRNIFN